MLTHSIKLVKEELRPDLPITTTRDSFEQTIQLKLVRFTGAHNGAVNKTGVGAVTSLTTRSEQSGV